MKYIQIKMFLNDPWREVALDAMERGQNICKRNSVNPDGYLAMCIGLCDIIRELKEEQDGKP
jgi:hypothetical protein